jgi:Protein kinase domain
VLFACNLSRIHSMTSLAQPSADGSTCPRCGVRLTVRSAASQLCPACLLDMALDIPDAPEQELSAGDASLPYDIITILAQDADAVTYLARGFVSATYLALKLLAVPDVAAMLTRINTWKPRLAALRHPGISRLVDAGQAGSDLVYLATEYVAGSSLNYLLRRRTLTTADRASIARQLAEALAAIHEKGLAHMRLDLSRIKVATTGGVRATILGVASGLIAGGLSPQPELDIAALAAVCRELGVPRP